MPDFGDNVRIKESSETVALGISGRYGEIYGFTTPSKTDIESVGPKEEDLAYSVNIKELDKQFWIAPSLIEFVDHGAGTEMRLDGLPMTWRKEADGSWTEVPDTASTESRKKQWWQFW